MASDAKVPDLKNDDCIHHPLCEDCGHYHHRPQASDCDDCIDLALAAARDAGIADAAMLVESWAVAPMGEEYLATYYGIADRLRALSRGGGEEGKR